jgi:hypothetical protein
MRTWRISLLSVCAIYLGACVTAAPGADKVRITKNRRIWLHCCR